MPVSHAQSTTHLDMGASLRGKHILITGASGGVGQATTQLFMDLNVKLSLAWGRSTLPTHMPKRQVVRSFDVADESATRNFLQAAVKTHGALDVVILIAGASDSLPLSAASSDGFDQDYQNNVKSTYNFLLHAPPLMNDGGAIVTFSSIRARTGSPSGLGYGAAKAAIINLTKSAALQLAPRIRVNAVAPGAVYPTNMSRKWSKEKQTMIMADTPLRRLCSPDEVAKLIAFLCSDFSAYITGQTIDINGGAWMN